MTPASTCSDAALTRMVAFRSAFPNLQARARADLMTFRNLAGVVDQLRTFGRTDAGHDGGGMRRRELRYSHRGATFMALPRPSGG
jgi:hypothetical protein